MTLTPVLYDLAPIGTNNSLEAISIYWYCSEECRDKDKTITQAPGVSSDYENGTMCEYCNEVIE